MAITLLSQGAETWLEGGWSLASDSTIRLLGSDVYSGKTAAQLAALDESDFTEPDFTGYSAASITSGGWSYSGDGPTVAEHTQLAFTCTAAPASPVGVHGYWLERDPDGLAIWFEPFPNGPFLISQSGDSLTFQPQITIG
jgi:hypothetical protein